MPSSGLNDQPDETAVDIANPANVAAPLAAPAQGLPTVAPDAGEEVYAGEIDDVVPTRGYHQLPVVGLGGSAGGIQALKSFFAALPSDAMGVAYVVILHLSPEHESTLPSLLQSSTSLPVKAAEDGERLLPDHVYVIPPRKHLTLTDGHLRLTALEPEYGKRVAVDLFFRSLADTHGPHAASIVLSGADSDGAIGIKHIKERGGLTVVQDPAEAEQEGMPRAAIATGMVDWVLPVADMPTHLTRYRANADRLRLPPEEGPQPAKPAPPTPDEDEQALREVLVLLRTRTGSDFTYYKRATILRRIARRMQINGIAALSAYLDFLRTQPGEAGALLQDLFVSVTNFFRDREAFAVVEAQIPNLFAGKGPGDTVRVWSAACATGEEPYSLAMLLHEQAGRLEHPPTIQVFGCDLDERAIQVARAGLYPATIAADVSEERLARFFIKEPGGYRVKRELRETVLFTQHDLLKDAPFSRMDLVSCRNLLIYLDAEAQARALDIFHFALKPEGLLFLGSAESVNEEKALFATLDKKHCLFVRRSTPRVGVPVPTGTGTLLRALQAQGKEAPAVPPAAFVRDATVPFAPPPRLSTQEEEAGLAELHYKLTERYAPPSLIVNAEGNIVHLSEHVGRFLRSPGGRATNNFLQMVLPALRMDLRAALLRAEETRAPAEVLGVAVELEEGVSKLVDLRVVPAAELAPGYVLVSFSARSMDTAVAAGAAPTPTDAEAVVRHLEREVESLRRQLRDTAERSRASEEEYKSSNEELQSMNEELRSAGEELETSREELQSLNEELSTVNHELKHNVEDASHANSDLHNLMNATAIATVFLCRELKVLRYTPAAVGLFNLIPSDTGRPLGHLKHRVDYPELEGDARQVLRTLVPVEREVSGPEGSWLFARLLPYRSLDDRIEGVVLTLVDVTARKRAEEAAREASARLRAMTDTAPVLIWETDPSGLVFFNQHYLDFFGRDFEAVRGMGWAEFLHPEDARGYLDTYRRAFAQGEPYEYECRFRRADGEYRWLLNVGQPFGTGHFVGCSVDITENKRAEAVLRESEERQTFLLSLSDRLRTLRDAAEIQNHAVQTLAQCLDVSRAGYYEFEADPDRFFLVASWEPGAKGLPERMSLADFGDEIREGYLAGRTMFMCDAEQEIASEANRAAHRDIEVRAWIGVPLIQDGRLVAAMGVHSKVPHRWTPAELRLCEDVTQRTWLAVQRARAEEALAKSEEKYRTLFDSIDEGFTVIDLIVDESGKPVDTFHLEANPAYERHTGLRGIVGKRGLEVLPELGEWLDFYGDVARTGQPVRAEYYVEPLGRWLAAYVSRVGGEGSMRLAVVFADVTERKQTEAALRESEEKYRATVNLVPALLWQADAQGDTIMHLARWSDYTGQTVEQIQSWGWLATVHPDDLPQTKHAFETAFRDGTPLEIEQRIRRHDGEYRWFLVRHVPVRNERGEVSRWYGAATDIDDLVRARAAAAAAGQAKDHFLAVLSHELRTPLMPITMALATLKRRADLPEPIRKTHEMIARNVELETRFIDELLDVTRIGHGKLEIVRADMDLHEAVRRAVEVAMPDLEAKGQQLTLVLEPAECRLQGDFTRLQQVFWNLLKNASKFTPEGGTITVRSACRPDADQVVEVTDTGIGMAAEAVERIFAPFEQANVDITRKYGGLGLGLAIAKASVDAHGGSLRASSPGVGQGATFTVSLPRG